MQNDPPPGRLVTFGTGQPERRIGDSRTKRLCDCSVVFVLLIVISPAMLIVAALVALSGPGPILFRQNRTGRGGQVFQIFKFRTMYVCEDGPVVEQARERDARVTPIGRILRATSLDELPQLFNVLIGDMSLVGPRPHAIAHDEHYAKLIDGYTHRFCVRPGITGLAQIRGYRGEIRTLTCMENRVAADREYIERWTPIFDAAILLRTIPRMMYDRHAY
ncbi:sugar transferase [Sphingomonas aracearum]|uniref:Exopolysaccharide biosynthesis protein n=1 Tax=Sphingomonas aracearum TaxID=2283317 RepID=A0A369VV92_9SPHN|nr:sugar transferase [Sphingomonas aracearum]RDE06306.1 exopolysaccharide biosynthesis protein [Sphingomonas aracearum]